MIREIRGEKKELPTTVTAAAPAAATAPTTATSAVFSLYWLMIANPAAAHGYYEESMSSIPLHPSLSAPAIAVKDGAAPSEPASLLARLRCRDESALVQIARHYAQAVTRAAYLHTGDATAAEDVAQEAFIAAWDGAHRTDDQTPLWPWLLGITLNHCRKHLRSLSRRRRREIHAHALHQAHIASQEAGKAQEAGSDSSELLRAALLALPEHLRCVIILRYEQGMNIAQTAAALDVPQGTVKRRCHVAIAQLRQHMRATS